jgi:DNA modification methylase
MAARKTKPKAGGIVSQDYELVPVGALTPNPANANQGDLGAVLGSIQTNKFYGAVYAQKSSGTIIAGEYRWRAAQEAGLEVVPVIYLDVTDAEAHRIMVADNRTTRLGMDDPLKMSELLNGIISDFGDLEGTGYDREDLDQIIADLNCGGGPVEGEDDAPEPPVNPISVLGDLWLLGEHRVLCGDSTSVDAVERLCGGAVADMVWTDPPYGVAYVGKTKDALTIENDALDDAGLEQLLRDSLGCALVACRAGAAWYVAAPPGPLHHIFSTVLKEMEVWRQTLNWVKSVFVMGRSDYHYRHEPIFYGWKPGAAHYFVDDRTQDTVLEIAKPSRSTEHPTMKPVELIERCISNSSRSGDTVLDPFLGSGSTLIACEKTGRICYGLEIAPAYVDVIVRRWQTFTGKEATLDGDGRTFAAVEAMRRGDNPDRKPVEGGASRHGRTSAGAARLVARAAAD